MKTPEQIETQFKALRTELRKKIQIASVNCEAVDATEIVKRYCELKKEFNELKK